MVVHSRGLEVPVRKLWRASQDSPERMCGCRRAAVVLLRGTAVKGAVMPQPRQQPVTAANKLGGS
jgi:hypothetical protein